jgi:hypothetical protein
MIPPQMCWLVIPVFVGVLARRFATASQVAVTQPLLQSRLIVVDSSQKQTTELHDAIAPSDREAPDGR